MDVRPILLFLGVLFIILSFWIGGVGIWLGAPMVFLGIIFQFIDTD